MTDKRSPSKVQIAAISAIALPLIATWEGMSTTAYYDVGRIPTICYGSIKGVRMGDTKTPQECREMLNKEIVEYVVAVDESIKVPVRNEVKAAFVSFAYNVGIGAFSKSTALKRLNQGNVRGACDAMLNWSYVGKMWVKGLHNRRIAERELCLKGV